MVILKVKFAYRMSKTSGIKTLKLLRIKWVFFNALQEKNVYLEREQLH